MSAGGDGGESPVRSQNDIQISTNESEEQQQTSRCLLSSWRFKTRQGKTTISSYESSAGWSLAKNAFPTALRTLPKTLLR